MRIEKVVAPVEREEESPPQDQPKIQPKPELVTKKEKNAKAPQEGKVISISDRRKKEKE